ncbi:hypothetical protein TNCV_554941 [Trichonephila clavipes]|nr:hypothetical protein TNCV_554941 [Trichonephila clavipes]
MNASCHKTWQRVINHPDGFLRYFLPKFAPIIRQGHQHSVVDAVAFPVMTQTCSIEEISGWPRKTATAGSDGVQSGRPIFDDFFQYLWPYIGNNTANVVFQMVKRLWLIRIDQ